MITQEIIDARNENLNFEEWRGTSDGVYHLSFLKSFESLGFDKEQLFTLLMKRLDNERDINIMEIQSRINEISDDEPPCDCDECSGKNSEPDI